MFWKLVLIIKMSTSQGFKTTFKYNLTCLFLSLRAKLKNTLCPRTPCSYFLISIKKWKVDNSQSNNLACLPWGFTQLKLVTVPLWGAATVPSRNCRHPGGPPISLSASYWRTLMSYCLSTESPPKTKEAVTQFVPSVSTITIRNQKNILN